MRLDARNGDFGWFVWHVRECREVRCVVWVDDEIACYGAWPSLDVERQVTWSDARPEPPTCKANRIQILVDRRLVLIDPVEPAEDETVSDALEAARNAPAEAA